MRFWDRTNQTNALDPPWTQASSDHHKYNLQLKLKKRTHTHTVIYRMFCDFNNHVKSKFVNAPQSTIREKIVYNRFWHLIHWHLTTQIFDIRAHACEISPESRREPLSILTTISEFIRGSIAGIKLSKCRFYSAIITQIELLTNECAAHVNVDHPRSKTIKFYLYVYIVHSFLVVVVVHMSIHMFTIHSHKKNLSICEWCKLKYLSLNRNWEIQQALRPTGHTCCDLDWKSRNKLIGPNTIL